MRIHTHVIVCYAKRRAMDYMIHFAPPILKSTVVSYEEYALISANHATYV